MSICPPTRPTRAPQVGSANTLGKQPTDHLNLIVRMLDGQSLHRLMRVCHRLALVAHRHLPAVQLLHNEALETALEELDRRPEDQTPDELTKVLSRYLVPGVTRARIGRCDEMMSRPGHIGRLLNDEHLELIYRKCGPELIELNISGLFHCGIGPRANSITDSTVLELVKVCYRLMIFRARHTTLTDQAARGLLERCPLLTHVDLWGCDKTSDVTVNALLATPSLTHVWYWNIKRYDIEDKFRQCRPDININWHPPVPTSSGKHGLNHTRVDWRIVPAQQARLHLDIPVEIARIDLGRAWRA